MTEEAQTVTDTQGDERDYCNEYCANNAPGQYPGSSGVNQTKLRPVQSASTRNLQRGASEEELLVCTQTNISMKYIICMYISCFVSTATAGLQPTLKKKIVDI